MPYKLLLADDSVTIQRVIELTFADEDIQVVAVSDGDQAIARLETDPPDIVLADVGMPGRDGYEVAAYVKRSPRLAHIPVVLLTGAFEPVDQVRADSAGCDGVLAKPFEPQLVIGRVKELLGQSGRPRLPLETPLAPSSGRGAVTWAPSPAEAPIRPMTSAMQAKAAGDDYFDRLDAAFAVLSNGSTAPTKPVAPGAGMLADSEDWFALKPGTVQPPDLLLSYRPSPTEFASPPAASVPASVPAPPRVAAPPAVSVPIPAAVPAPPRVAAPAASVPVPAAAPVPPQVAAPPAASVSIPPAVPAPPRVAAPPAAFVPFAPVAPVASPAVSAPRMELQPIKTALVAPAAEEAAPRPPLPALADAFAALLAAEQFAPDAAAPAWPSPPAATAAISEELIEQVTRRVLERLTDRVVRDTASQVVPAVAERFVREEIERIKAAIK